LEVFVVLSPIPRISLVLFLLSALTSRTFEGAQGIAAAASSSGTGPDWYLSVSPELSVPLGAEAEYFGIGGGAGLSATLRLPSLPLFYMGGGLDYSYLTTKAPGTSVYVVDLGAEAGVQLQLAHSLTLRAGGEAGYFLSALNAGGPPPDYNPYVMGGAQLSLGLKPSLQLSLGAAYRYRAYYLSDLAASLGLSVKLGASALKTALPKGYLPLQTSGRGIGFIGSKLDTVFPVFFKHYDDHSLGSIIVRNFEDAAAKDIKATVEVKRYMDQPKSIEVVSELGPGATGELKLYGLFTDKILEIVEATKLPVSVKLSYSQYGKACEEEYVGTLSVLDRNAITWDDDRKAAAFISSKDPLAMAFAKGVAASTRELQNPEINQNLQAAMAMHEALRVQGVNYVKDPSSALETSDRKIVDFILFPQQTLAFNSGKCGDLTVLYCSMMESVGLSTALITTPGHILMAVDLEMSPDQAKRTFLRPEDLIERNGSVWLPIETTIRKDGFAKAWQEGARGWRENSAKGAAAFYPIHDAWKAYQPVVLAGNGTLSPQKDAKAGAAAFKSQLAQFIASETGPRVAAIQADIKKRGGSAQLHNKLGVLYARYGLLDKAADQFGAALKSKSPGASAVYNMGNILFLQGKYAEALGYYTKALSASPSNATALLAVARSSAALGKYDAALSSYQRLEAADPALASKYAYLGGGSDSALRAADADKSKGDQLWQD
jgi:tetratricopeptide (TPR) repeat protein